MEASYLINRPDNEIVKNATTDILKRSDALKFHTGLPEYRPTPLFRLPDLALKYNVGDIYIKDESHRFGLNAFKGLGAVYAISELLKENPNLETFCTATDGNHGRAVAWGATRFEKRSVVFVPGDTTLQRMKCIEKEGARVEKVQGNYDDACAVAEKACKENGWELVQDMAWEGYEKIPADIMAGYLSLFREMEDSIHTLPDSRADVVFMQAGVGSFAGAGAFYYLNRYGARRPRIVTVEPLEADGIFASFTSGQLTTSTGNATTIMAGLNCGTPSLGAWDILKNGVDVALKIPDHYARRAVRELFFPDGCDRRIISGESGAGGLAGFLAVMSEKNLEPVRKVLNITKSSNVLFISTEGDTDKTVFNEIITTGESTEKK